MTEGPADSEQTLPEFDKIKEKWGLILQHVKTKSVPAHALLKDATPAGVRNGALIVHFKHAGQAKLLEDTKGVANPKRKAIQDALTRVFG
ncbi:MAG: hypothetical protein ACPL7O_10705, partial [Armatimonadota bacterium]